MVISPLNVRQGVPFLLVELARTSPDNHLDLVEEFCGTGNSATLELLRLLGYEPMSGYASR